MENSELKGGEKGEVLWDCGSSLYDSYELRSFERQLDSAIISSSYSRRSLSMPHHHFSSSTSLMTPHHPRHPPRKPAAAAASKITRSFYKLIRSLFKNNKQSDHNHHGHRPCRCSSPAAVENRTYVVYDGGLAAAGPSLSTIHDDVLVVDGISPEVRSLVTRRTSSDRRFTPPSMATTASPSMGIFSFD